jgi:hypothetical protein
VATVTELEKKPHARPTDAALLLRVPLSLRDAVRQAATADGTSINKWATMVLSRELGRRENAEIEAEAEAAASTREQYAKRRNGLHTKHQIEEE